jgi:Cellobiose phosphorylase
MRFETDRTRFIGRGRSLANPRGGTEEPQNSEGFVLDPILSLRTSLSLAPGQRVTVSLVIAAGGTKEQVLGLMGKYADPPRHRSRHGISRGPPRSLNCAFCASSPTMPAVSSSWPATCCIQTGYCVLRPERSKRILRAKPAFGGMEYPATYP